MRAIEIAVKDLKIIVRDLKALAIIIAMPLILIVILGAALGGMFSQSETISRFQVAVVDLDGGPAAAAFKDLLVSPEISRLMTTVSAVDREEALQLIDAGEVSAAVIIPAGVSDFTSASTKTFEVLSDPGYPLRGQVTKGIVESYAQQYSALSAGTSGALSALMEASGGAFPVPRVAQVVRAIQERLLSVTRRSAGLFSSSKQESTWISASQYYTAGMTVMFVMYGAMLGAKSIFEEKSQKTMARLFSTTVTRGDIVVGKTLATFLISLLQILALIAFTALVLRVKWGDVTGVFSVTASMALAATGFSMFVSAIAKTEKMADALENAGVQVMAFLGGCQFPMYLFPPVLQAMSRVTFTRWGLEGYLTLMQGQPLSAVAHHVVIIAGAGLAFLAAGIWRLNLE
jgi:ABC-2 type transport system permease protein